MDTMLLLLLNSLLEKIFLPKMSYRSIDFNELLLKEMKSSLDDGLG
jgi:hypothetical protein